MARLRGAHPATLLMAVAVAASGAYLMSAMAGQIFWRDEWSFVLHRREWELDTFLEPFVEQFLAIPILIYKSLLGVFGMESGLPFRIASLSTFLLSVVLVFVYARRRCGAWIALAGCLPILFLGIAWDDLLFPFQIAFFGSVAAGVGALLVLERGDRRGDVAAAILLIASLCFSAVGIVFVAAATAALALTPERWRRAAVVAVPTALWVVWFLGWGREAETNVSAHNVATLIGYVLDGWAASVASLLGLRAEGTLAGPSLPWGRALLVAGIALAAWRIVRLGGVPRGVWPVLAAGTLFWVMCGLNAAVYGQANSGRYQYLGAIFVVFVAAELLRGVQLRRGAVVVVVAVSAVATLSNFSVLDSAANGLAQIHERERAGLAALELSRETVDPAFELDEENADVVYLGYVDAGSYFSAIDEHGSPAFSADELAEAPEYARVAADKVFAAALPVAVEPAEARTPGDCRVLRRPGDETMVSDGELVRSTAGAPELRMRRYAAESYPVSLGSLDGTGRLSIPDDLAPASWVLGVGGEGSVRVCGAEAAP